MSSNSSKYKKRSWFVALVLHLLVLSLILVGYFIYLYHANEVPKHVSVEDSNVISADLLSFQQTESVLSADHQSQSSEPQVKLEATQAGKQPLNVKTSESEKSGKEPKQIQQDEVQKQSLAQKNIHQLSTQAQVNHYMASLASYLYQQISQDVVIEGQAKGDISATISVSGQISNIEVNLEKPNPKLKMAIENIIGNYQPIETITDLKKPIRVRYPFRFE